ncbi:hypothetical protein EDC96DRAFT_468315 [Choanephora cucurbitarum]|nr:hypothetical protein EDC96DRAFT_468315 [Choanephora cucurbitarum]
MDERFRLTRYEWIDGPYKSNCLCFLCVYVRSILHTIEVYIYSIYAPLVFYMLLLFVCSTTQISLC